MQHTASPIRYFLPDDSALSRSRVAAVLLAQGMLIAGQAVAMLSPPRTFHHPVSSS